jgi:hypothetical protein
VWTKLLQRRDRRAHSALARALTRLGPPPQPLRGPTPRKRDCKQGVSVTLLHVKPPPLDVLRDDYARPLLVSYNDRYRDACSSGQRWVRGPCATGLAARSRTAPGPGPAAPRRPSPVSSRAAAAAAPPIAHGAQRPSGRCSTPSSSTAVTSSGGGTSLLVMVGGAGSVSRIRVFRRASRWAPEPVPRSSAAVRFVVVGEPRAGLLLGPAKRASRFSYCNNAWGVPAGHKVGGPDVAA